MLKLIRKEVRSTPKGNKYTVHVSNCKNIDCNKEIFINASKSLVHSGYCRNCNDFISRKISKLKTRICKCCKIEQDIFQFTTKNFKSSVLTCRKCINLKKYGINYRQYLEILKKQKSKCVICRNSETAGNNKVDILSLAVDHCRTTGKVRGLLCKRCNQGIGLFEDKIKYLRSAIRYLLRSFW